MAGMTLPEATWVGRARTFPFFALALVVVASIGVLAAKPAHASTFTVTTTDDSGAGSLRQGIEDANSPANSGADTIEFNIPATDTGCNATSGVCTISPSSVLPLVTNPVIIDGYSQPGARANTLSVGDDAVLKIELSGPEALNGLKILADNSTVQGLVVNNWENGIFLGVDATGNTVRGNFIGTDVTGRVTDPDGISNNGDELGNTIGVALTNALNNTIGGTTAGARNIISGSGIGISISGGTENKIQGDYIGTNAAGDTRLGNNQGVALTNAPNNTIGGTTAGARNIISGNGAWGIRISDAESTGNKVQGNYIGTDVTGRVTDPDGIPNNGDELGNLFNGVSIQTGSSNTTIGGTTAAGATSSPATATTAVPTPPTRKAASRSNLPLVMAPTRLRATASSPTPSTTMLGSGSTSITPTTTPGSPATTSLPPG